MLKRTLYLGVTAVAGFGFGSGVHFYLETWKGPSGSLPHLPLTLDFVPIDYRQGWLLAAICFVVLFMAAIVLHRWLMPHSVPRSEQAVLRNTLMEQVFLPLLVAAVILNVLWAINYVVSRHIPVMAILVGYLLVVLVFAGMALTVTFLLYTLALHAKCTPADSPVRYRHVNSLLLITGIFLTILAGVFGLHPSGEGSLLAALIVTVAALFSVLLLLVDVVVFMIVEPLPQSQLLSADT